MVKLVGSRVSRLAKMAGTAVGLAGLAAVALTPMYSGAAASTIPYAYVTNWGSHTVSVISTSTNTVAKTVKVGGSPFGVAFTPNRSDAYVTEPLSGSVSVIKLSTNTVVTTVKVGGGSRRHRNHPQRELRLRDQRHLRHRERDQHLQQYSCEDGEGRQQANLCRSYSQRERPYVTNVGSGTVSVIKTSSNTVVKTVEVGLNPFGVAITPNGRYAYVANNGSRSGTVSVISTATDAVVKTLIVGGYPAQVSVTPNGSDAYVTNDGSKSVSVINTSTNTVVKTVKISANPYGVACVYAQRERCLRDRPPFPDRERDQDIHQHGGEIGECRHRPRGGRHQLGSVIEVCPLVLAPRSGLDRWGGRCHGVCAALRYRV